MRNLSVPAAAEVFAVHRSHGFPRPSPFPPLPCIHPKKPRLSKRRRHEGPRPLQPSHAHFCI